jgi:hypothetical protein
LTVDEKLPASSLLRYFAANQSLVFAISTVQHMSNADFAKPEKKLGPDANDGDVVYLW